MSLRGNIPGLSQVHKLAVSSLISKVQLWGTYRRRHLNHAQEHGAAHVQETT